MMETECEALFFRNKPFWHLCTPGESMEIIYTDEIEFNFGINLLAICLAEFPDLTAYTFELMNNHIHIILSGPEEDCLGMFNLYKVKLHQFIQRKKRIVDLSGFMPEVLPIEDLRAFRNETVYVNRNGYVVNPSTTPFSMGRRQMVLHGLGPLYFKKVLFRVNFQAEERNITRQGHRTTPVIFSVEWHYHSAIVLRYQGSTDDVQGCAPIFQSPKQKL